MPSILPITKLVMMISTNLAEDDVLAIEPLGLGGAQEELGAVGVRSSVGHREHSWGEEKKLSPSLVADKYHQKRLNCNFCTVLPFPYWSRIGRSKSVEMRDA